MSNDGPFEAKRTDFHPWEFWSSADEKNKHDQHELQRLLREQHGYTIGEHCYISENAAVFCDSLQLGDRSCIAASAYVTHTLSAGPDCTINAFAVVRGKVDLGAAVRIGAHASILGFNHTTTDLDTEVFRQPIVYNGITVGDDVWIGSHAVLLDGVTVGSKAIIGASAVVTKDVPAGAVVAGNPARIVRWRGPQTSGNAASSRLRDFSDRVRDQGPCLLERYWVDAADSFSNRPGDGPTVRAQCDAIEVADLLIDAPPPQRSAADHIELLKSWQRRTDGIIPTLQPSAQPMYPLLGIDADSAYHFLSVGYALDILGAALETTIQRVQDASPTSVIATVRALAWDTDAWASGAWVDAFGSAVLINLRSDSSTDTAALEALIGWLTTHANPDTGLWGSATAAQGLLQPVNGFYRASRGTFAQYGVPLPYPRQIIDTVLRHADDARYFAPSAQNACNVLDVAHPLWLTRAAGYRSKEVRGLAERLLSDALARWVDDQGFGFHAAGDRATPELQGTEMWLAIIWYLADLLGTADLLGYEPRGVHRPEAAVGLSRPAPNSRR